MNATQLISSIFDQEIRLQALIAMTSGRATSMIACVVQKLEEFEQLVAAHSDIGR